MRILTAGQMVEDVDKRQRIFDMVSWLTASESRGNQAIEAFGYNWGSDQNQVRDYDPAIKLGQVLIVLIKPFNGSLRPYHH